MADSGLFVGWGQVVRGREQRALEVFNEVLAFYGKLQEDGRIESAETVLLEPHGGDLAGFTLMGGSEDQIAALRADEEFQRLMQRADLMVDGLGIVGASLGEGVGTQIATYQQEISSL
jgi:hypothetical protein